MRRVRYLVDRLNVSGNYDTFDFSEKEDFLRQLFLAGNTVERRGLRYRFAALQFIRNVDLLPELDTYSFFAGWLVKYDPDGEVERLDETRITPVHRNVPNKIRATSDFLLEVKHGLLSYHPESGEISPSQFRENFCELLERALEGIPVQADIKTTSPRKNVLKELRSFDSVTRVRASLYPSNPNFHEYWKPVDERLKKAEASKLSETYSVDGEPGEKSLNVDDDSPVSAAVSMAADGYGEASVVGIKDGKPDQYRTEADTTEVQAPRIIESGSQDDEDRDSDGDRSEENEERYSISMEGVEELISRVTGFFEVEPEPQDGTSEDDENSETDDERREEMSLEE